MGIFFRYQQKGNILNVDDAYAHLVTVRPNGDFEFEFTYSVSQHDVISYGARVVSITVFCRNVSAKPLLGSANVGAIDTQAVVSNIRTQLPDAKATLQQRATYVLVQRNSDITAYINNDIIPQLRAQVPTRDIQQLNRPRLQLVPASSTKQSNDPQPILTRVASTRTVPDLQQAMTGSFNEDPQRLMQDMIMRQGIDPSSIVQLTPRSASAIQSLQGFSNPAQAIEELTDPASRLLNYHLFPTTNDVPPTTTDAVGDSEMVQVVQLQSSDVIEVPVTVVIPSALLRLEGADITKLFVRFDLVNAASGEPVDSVTKPLNIVQHNQVYITPKLAPIVRAKAAEVSTRVNLEIRQVDPGAKAVRLLKKSLYTASPDVTPYTPVGIYNLSANQQPLLVQVDQPKQSPTLYRAIPLGSATTQGFEFTNVVLRPSRYVAPRACALTAMQVASGIQLEVRNIPLRVVAVQFLKWNLTTHDSTFSTVGDDVGFIDDPTRKADLLTTTDTDVFSDNIYRYVARLVYDEGLTEDFGDATVEFITPAPGQVDTQVSNLTVSHDGVPNVAFDIVTSTLDTDLDAVKAMLGVQDQQQFFQGDLQAQRDQLKALIAHNVQRVDLTTGKREDFGILTVSHFDDTVLRRNQAIDALQYGHDYRYEIMPLLRAAETMFDSLQKELTDGTTNKPYSFSPAKYLHPFVLRNGVLVTTLGGLLRYGKEPMAYGIVGSLTTVAASFDNDTAKVIDQSAVRFDRHLNIVSWRVQGDVSQVDHFVVFKEVHGVRTTIGKAHSSFPFGSCQYVHQVTHADNGSIAYAIVPVMNDYKVGPTVLTNSVLVDAP